MLGKLLITIVEAMLPEPRPVISAGFDEAHEIPVGDLVFVDQETIHLHDGRRGQTCAQLHVDPAVRNAHHLAVGMIFPPEQKRDSPVAGG